MTPDNRRPKGTPYRVWITTTTGKRGRAADPRIACEPAEPGTMTRRLAHAYVEAFNQAARAAGRPLRAVALPVRVRYEGDLQEGWEVRLPPPRCRK